MHYLTRLMLNNFHLTNNYTCLMLYASKYVYKIVRNKYVTHTHIHVTNIYRPLTVAFQLSNID